MMRITLSILLVLRGLVILGQNVDSLICTPYLDNGLVVSYANDFDFSSSYTASGSTWAIDSFPESQVFHAQIDYTSSVDTTESFSFRVGKGGNIYSFRGVFGESVAPQWRNSNWVQPTYGGGTSYAPWVDEVWQMVAVDGVLNNVPDSSYFIHQAGVYLKTPQQTQPFFSPMLAEYYNEDDRSYSVVNWGQQAHTEDIQNTGFRSDLLYYTRYKVLGDGILQVDNMIYNFGEDNISFINIPWGGVRNSSLEHFFISDPSSNYALADGLYGQTPVIQTANTGGWMAWSNDSLGNSPTLAMAHPKTTSTNGNVFRYGDAGNLSNPNNLRDYHVFEMIRFPSNEQLSFGTALSFRFFYVLGANVDSARSTILDNGLVNAAFDSDLIPQKWEIDSIAYDIDFNGSGFSVNQGMTGLMLRAVPYMSSYPLFLITSNVGQAITSDPYHFSQIPYDGITENIELLGFLDHRSRVAIQHDTVCYAELFTFPDGNTQVIETDLTYISTVNSVQAAWDSIIVSHLHVVQLNDGVVQTGSTLTSAELNVVYQWLDCEANYSQIFGEMGQDFIPTSSGTYAVEIFDGTCTDTSSCTMVNLVGSRYYESGNAVRLYPNPNGGQFTLKLNSKEDYLVQAFNALGQSVFSKQFKSADKVSIELLTVGVYHLVVRSEEAIYMEKVVVQ
jgi:hypothetical protein